MQSRSTRMDPWIVCINGHIWAVLANVVILCKSLPVSKKDFQWIVVTLDILGTLKQLSCIPSRLYNAVCLTMCLFASSLSLIVLIPLKESNSADLCFVLLCIYAVCRWPQDEGVHVPIYQVKGTCTGHKAVCTVHKSVFT